jgi:hypothetical protein
MGVSSPNDDDVIRRMNYLLLQSNVLQERLIEDNLMRPRIWQETSANNLAEQHHRSWNTLTDTIADRDRNQAETIADLIDTSQRLPEIMAEIVSVSFC